MKERFKRDPKKLAAIRDWLQLRTKNEVRIFLGLANYHRKYIKDFLEIAKPLIELTPKTNKNIMWC
jgi:hypothetical protein